MGRERGRSSAPGARAEPPGGVANPRARRPNGRFRLAKASHSLTSTDARPRRDGRARRRAQIPQFPRAVLLVPPDPPSLGASVFPSVRRRGRLVLLADTKLSLQIAEGERRRTRVASAEECNYINDLK